MNTNMMMKHNVSAKQECPLKWMPVQGEFNCILKFCVSTGIPIWTSNDCLRGFKERVYSLSHALNLPVRNYSQSHL